MWLRLGTWRGARTGAPAWAPCWPGDGGPAALHPLSAAGLYRLFWLGHRPLRGTVTQRVSESSGLPLAGAGLGTAPHGDGWARSFWLQRPSWSTLHLQGSHRWETGLTCHVAFRWLLFCCVFGFRVCFQFTRATELWQLPCKVGRDVKTEISGKWLLQTTLAPWYFRLFSTHPWK